MNLLDKPHCKKHEVYTQNCIGCRIKASGLRPEFVESVFSGSTSVIDLADKRSDADTKAFTSAQITEVGKLLKAIYNDGAAGNKRNLSKDIETLRRLT